MISYKLSQLFQPRIIAPPGKERGADLTSTSQKVGSQFASCEEPAGTFPPCYFLWSKSFFFLFQLLSNLGLVRSNLGGTNVLLPIAVRAIEKLKRLIKKELELVGSQEIVLPALTPQHLFKQTGRDGLPELFMLKDRRDKQFILSPTHEEAIVNLIASVKPSYKSLPLFLYQMTSKFRDEIKPRFGLMRSKEFIMKDLYCFDASAESSRSSYDKINECYHRIFQGLNVPYCCVEGCTGEIGGSLSHEFHILSHVGEDKVVICEGCGHGENSTNTGNASACVKCNSPSVSQRDAIEVSFTGSANY